MSTPWLEFACATVRWKLDRLLRRRPPRIALPPGRPVREPLPADDSTEAAPGFTATEANRLCALTDWLASASGGTREWGGRLADHMRLGLPDVDDTTLTRVLLSAGEYLAEAADAQDGEHEALRVIADALQGAPVVLAELDLALAERGGR